MHVPFPTDLERTPGLAFNPDRVRAALPRSTLLRGPAPDLPQVLAGVLATIFRTTGQEQLSLDLFGPGPAARTLECRCAGEGTFEAFVEEVRRALRDARDVSPGNAGSSLALSWGPLGAGAPTPYELHVVLDSDTPGGGLELIFDASLFRSSTASRLLATLAFVLEGLEAAPPGRRVDELPILDPVARLAVLQAGDGGPGLDRLRCFLERFGEAARKGPDAVAARYHEQTLRYRELDERSGRLAEHLLRRGLRPGDVVAVGLLPSLDLVVAILAVFKARLVYLPLDPTNPQAYLARMLEEARPSLVLLQGASAELDCFQPFASVRVDEALPPDGLPLPDGLDLRPRLDDRAYLFYTSGTTGRPKGVIATQRNLAHYLHVAREAYGFTARDRFSSIARATFSISLFDLLSPLSVGGSVHLMDRDQVLSPEALSRALEEVTVVHAGPSLLTNFLRFLRSSGRPDRTYANVRHVSSGGDLVSASLMEELKRLFPAAEVFTIYGCTEVSCMGTTFRVERDRTVRRSFVGHPFPGVGVRVLDAHQQLVPFGVVGEICFRGEGLASGYLLRPALNAEKFIELDGQRYYRTGDVGRLHETGALEILGRHDDQIQLRGIRLELAGIENTVRELGLAAHCAIAHQKTDEDERLVAFVVDPRDRELKSFRRVLSRALPEYMLPQHLVILEKLPLTPNGKLDRRALLALPWSAAETEAGPGTPPRTEQERALAAIFARLLRRPAVGVDQDFFDLGGHSLLAVMAIHEVSEALGRPVRPQAFFENATIAGLLQSLRSGETGAHPILLNERRGRPPLFMLSGLHIYRPLAKALEGSLACFGVFADLELTPAQGGPRSYSVEELAQEYLQIIRREQPRGPYRLLGYSFAGIVTYEVAQRLRREGEEVRLLVLIDAALPEWLSGWQFRVDQLRRLVRARPAELLSFGLRRLGRRRVGGRLAIPRYRGDRDVGAIEAQRDEVNDTAAARYYPSIRPFPGRALVIASAGRLRADPLKSQSCGWEPFVGRLESRTVAGDHFEMIEQPPSVARIAEYIAQEP
jgi:amino acid adenylation domain-containing protein